MAIVLISCGGNSTRDKERIAELEAQIDELKKGGNNADCTSSEENSSNVSSTTTSSTTTSSQSMVGTYEFSDNINTWVLVVDIEDGDKTCYIYNKSKGDDIKCYGSWWKMNTQKFAHLSFSDKVPHVFFPSEESSLSSPCITKDWIYSGFSAAESKNPNLRLPLKKIN